MSNKRKKVVKANVQNLTPKRKKEPPKTSDIINKSNDISGKFLQVIGGIFLLAIITFVIVTSGATKVLAGTETASLSAQYAVEHPRHKSSECGTCHREQALPPKSFFAKAKGLFSSKSPSEVVATQTLTEEGGNAEGKD